MRVDWENYYNTFPARYLVPSRFDAALGALLEDKPIKTVVDIGGGKGTKVLNKRRLQVWLLDPYVRFSEWMMGSVGWDVDAKFDLAVCRSSINYLTEEEIKKIPRLAERFIANTFIKPPLKHWSSRSYETLSGSTKGTEYSKFDTKRSVVKHRLVPEGKESIEHEFFWYSIEEYRTMLPGIKVERYGKNSALLKGRC